MNQMPTWQEFLLPTLQVLSDGQKRYRGALCALVANHVDLDEQQRSATISSGQFLYENRIGWGLSLLTKVGALERPARGYYTISDAGRWLLNKLPVDMNEKNIKALAEDVNSPLTPYVESTRSEKVTTEPENVDISATPLEQIEAGLSRINAEVSAELLARIRDKEPAFFERAVVDLLLAMNYGGTHGRGVVTKLSNDGGIDGVIDQDALGLSKVYVQAKRYAADNAVQRPEVQRFVGALSGKAEGGIFITTGRFSSGAAEYAKEVPSRIILVDGEELARLMLKFKVGIQVRETHEIVELDEDFFS